MKTRSHEGFKRTMRTMVATVFILTLAIAEAAHASIDINFEDSTALWWIVNQARGTFAYGSGWNGSSVTFCSGGTYYGCWQYAQPTTDAAQNFYWFYVFDGSPSGAGNDHYHLVFQDGTIGACFVDPGDGGGVGFGRLVNGSCVAPDWVSEHRMLMPEDRDAWVQMWADYWREFTPQSIFNRHTIPIQIWVLATDGYWYYADNIGTGLTNTLSAIANGQSAWEVDIAVASSYGGYGPFLIDDFIFDYP